MPYVPASNETSLYKIVQGIRSLASAAVTYAPKSADYLVKTANSTLSAERVVTDTTSITWDWGTAGQAKAQHAAFTGDVTAPINSNALSYIQTNCAPASSLSVAASCCLIAVRKYVSPTGGTLRTNVPGIALGTNAILKVM